VTRNNFLTIFLWK